MNEQCTLLHFIVNEFTHLKQSYERKSLLIKCILNTVAVLT